MEQERPDAEVPPGEGRHFNALLRLLKQLKEAVQATAQEITPRIPGWQPGKERPALAGRWNSGVPSLGLACADAMRVAPPIFATMEFTPEQLIQLAEMVREIGEFMAMLGPALEPMDELYAWLRDALCTMTRTVVGQVNGYRALPVLDDGTRSMVDTAGELIGQATAPGTARHKRGMRKARARREQAQAARQATPKE